MLVLTFEREEPVPKCLVHLLYIHGPLKIKNAYVHNCTHKAYSHMQIVREDVRSAKGIAILVYISLEDYNKFLL